MIYPTCLLNSAILAGFHCSSKETDLETDINLGEGEWIKKESKARKLRQTVREGTRIKERWGKKMRLSSLWRKSQGNLVKKKNTYEKREP